MKPIFLLLLLLLAAQAWGQGFQMRDSLDTFLLYGKKVKVPIWNAAIPMEERTVLTLESWQEYKRECWNDSVSHGRGQWFTDQGSTWWVRQDSCWEASRESPNIKGIDIILVPCPERWTHREPSFEGWMEWIQKH